MHESCQYKPMGGAFLHRPRGHGPVEPIFARGGCQMPPTSSWWALETPQTRPSAARAGGQVGGTAAAAARSEERSCSSRRHTCFFTPPGLRGTRSQECGRSWRKEVRLPGGSTRSCFVGSRSAVAVRAGQDRERRQPRYYPRYRTGPTVRHRRRRGWQEVTRTREILSPRT